MNRLIPWPRVEVKRELARIAEVWTEEMGWEPPRIEDVRASDELVYASVPNIGTSGALLVRKTGRVHILGSVHPAETSFWAYGRGFRLDETNVLVITAVRDTEAAIEVFKRAFKAPWVRDDLAPQFAKLPVRVELDWSACWSMLRALQETDAFDFEVNPS